MSLKDNFRLDSFLLFPYWITLFSIPGALVLTPLFIIGHYAGWSEPSEWVFLCATLLSCIASFLLIKRYPSLAFKTIVVMAVLFTVCFAAAGVVIGYVEGGILGAILTPLVICGVSYVIHNYALTRGETRTRIFFF